MENSTSFRVGRKTKRAVLNQLGQEIVVCVGKDANKKAEMICNALNLVYGNKVVK